MTPGQWIEWRRQFHKTSRARIRPTPRRAWQGRADGFPVSGELPSCGATAASTRPLAPGRPAHGPACPPRYDCDAGKPLP